MTGHDDVCFFQSFCDLLVFCTIMFALLKRSLCFGYTVVQCGVVIQRGFLRPFLSWAVGIQAGFDFNFDYGAGRSLDRTSRGGSSALCTLVEEIAADTVHSIFLFDFAPCCWYDMGGATTNEIIILTESR